MEIVELIPTSTQETTIIMRIAFYFFCLLSFPMTVSAVGEPIDECKINNSSIDTHFHIVSCVNWHSFDESHYEMSTIPGLT